MTINTIQCIDCFKLLDSLKDDSINLAILDPPYNMQKASWDSFDTAQEFFSFTYGWIDKLIPKLKLNGSMYIFNTPYNSAYILRHLVKRNMYFQNWITWDKRDGLGNGKRKFSNGQETILFFTKSNSHTFNYDDVRIPYESRNRIANAQKKGILKNGKRWYPNPIGKYCGEVWHISSARHKQKVNGKIVKLPHITPKPIELIERIIKASSNKGDLVVDCFVGSGTTAMAAKKLGRNYICGDNNEEYVELAKANLKTV